MTDRFSERQIRVYGRWPTMSREIDKVCVSLKLSMKGLQIGVKEDAARSPDTSIMPWLKV